MSGPVVDSRTFRIGFLAALETDDGAFVAGLLVTNRYGRPLEFQCTSPVRPTHAQQLLYGETLRPFLLGALMGRALLDRLGSPPDLLVTDNDDILDCKTMRNDDVFGNGALSELGTSGDSDSAVGVHGSAYYGI